PMLVQEIFRTIAGFKRERRTVLLVEQNARKALQCADRGYVLETGAIVLTGSGESLLKSEAVQAAYLGGRAKGTAGPQRAPLSRALVLEADGLGEFLVAIPPAGLP